MKNEIDKSSKELETNNVLVYSLLCIVNMETILKENSIHDVFEFMNKSHPNSKAMNLRPLISETIKEVNGKPVIFAFFLPTKEKNPSSDRVLFDSSFIKYYREKNKKFIENNHSFNSWQEILNHYSK